jgi:hypothetical protein
MTAARRAGRKQPPSPKPLAIADIGRNEREHPEPGNLRTVHPLTLHACLG